MINFLPLSFYPLPHVCLTSEKNVSTTRLSFCFKILGLSVLSFFTSLYRVLKVRINFISPVKVRYPTRFKISGEWFGMSRQKLLSC